MKFKEKILNIYKRFDWFIKEIVKTFSDQPSFFSRKRIESCILFVNAMILLDTFCYKNWDKITTEQMLLIFGAQMVYAGYQVTQIRKDIKMMSEIKENEKSDEQ